jgi:hypothetical protein
MQYEELEETKPPKGLAPTIVGLVFKIILPLLVLIFLAYTNNYYTQKQMEKDKLEQTQPKPLGPIIEVEEAQFTPEINNGVAGIYVAGTGEVTISNCVFYGGNLSDYGLKIIIFRKHKPNLVKGVLIKGWKELLK